MNFAGFTLLGYILLALFVVMIALTPILFARDDKVPQSWIPFKKGTDWAGAKIVMILLAIAGIAYVCVAQDYKLYSTSGEVVTVDTHGDGAHEKDYSVIDTDVTNVALVVKRQDLPSVSVGDRVDLKCTQLDEKVYSCTGSVSKPNSE